MARAPLAGLVALALAGCGGAAARTVSRVAAASCSTQVADGPALRAPTAAVRVPGSPFGVATASSGSLGIPGRRRRAGFDLSGLEATAAAHARDRCLTLGRAVVGLATSPDGRWLYATSELAAGKSPTHGGGSLSVIRVASADRDPRQSVVASVQAACGPVRVAVSADGATVWVTARESDLLLAFSAARLVDHPAQALEATVRVGEAPVGLALIDGGRELAVADSNRFRDPHARTGVTIVGAAAALAGKPAVLGTIPTGLFPREMALEQDGRTLLVGDFGAGTLQAIDVAGIPRDRRRARAVSHLPSRAERAVSSLVAGTEPRPTRELRMRALVAGATGTIGRQLIPRPAAAALKVGWSDAEPSGHEPCPRWTRMDVACSQ
jgi:hypothetical protein